MKQLSNNKGAALAMVIIVMVVLMILGTSALAIGLSETKFSVASEKTLQAEYIAKAGADIGADLFIRDKNFSNTNIITTPMAWGNGEIVSVTADIGTDYVEITSTGKVDTFSRSVSLHLTREKGSGIFDGIRLTGAKSEFNLNALDISHAPGDVVNITANVPSEENIILNDEDKADAGIVVNVSDVGLDPVVVPTGTYSVPDSITSKDAETHLYDSQYILKSLTSEKNSLTFHVPAGDEMIVVVDDLLFKQAVTITGGGTVRLYIKQSAILQTPIDVNTAATGYLFIYVAKGKKIELQANGVIGAYIYAPEAIVQFNSDWTTLKGAMVGQLIYKNPSGEGPHGNFVYVPLPDGEDDSTIDYGYTKSYYYK